MLDEQCPFQFNFDPERFEIGDTVSYRVPDRFGDMPFVGTLTAVEPDYVLIAPLDFSDSGQPMRGTRTSRPVVAAADALS